MSNSSSNTTGGASSFAQAQQRLAARREERERATQASIVAHRSASRAWQQASRLPWLLSRAGGTVLAAWEVLHSRDGTRPAFRVGQVDAELLDEDLLGQLRDQVADSLRYVAGGTLKDDWSAEIQLALRALLFKLSIWDNDATYGAALQNLKYTDARRSGPVLTPPSRWQKGLYGLFTVAGKYGWEKWETWLLDQDNGYDDPSPLVRRLSSLTNRLTTFHSLAAFASFLVFLLHGRYRTLLDRVLRMRLAPPTNQVSREVSFEYLNRQLVWHAFTEFLLFVLPLVGINRWRRWLSRTWRKTKEIIHVGSGSGEDGEKRGELAFLPERTCAICYQDQNSAVTENEVMAAAASAGGGVIGSTQTDITNPYETIPCACVYCFVCLATRLEREEGEGWACLRCGELVKECKPWGGDVLEKPSKSSSSPSAKHVGFADDVVDRSASPTPSYRTEKRPRDDRHVTEDARDDMDDDNDDTPERTDSEIYEEEEDGVQYEFSD